MSNVYADLCLAVQALRREFEGLRTPLAPATGVGANIYTHQVANAYRVLTDLRVRHLLADEVGLGKTVQALMILNALRFQRHDVRALVVVPDRLVPQWRDEILTRAHSVPIGADVDGEGRQYIRLAWEAQLKMKTAEGIPKWALSDIDPDRYQVLIVDELHRLTEKVQDRIHRVAPRFEHLLLLTATPAFQDPAQHAEILKMLEPENCQLVEFEEGAGRDIVEALLERDKRAAASCASGDLTNVALAHCAYRRVIRTRRADYGRVLPTRKHVPILTDPLGAEEDRQALMWEYFKHLGDITLEVEPVKLAKRVILSPPSLEQRVDFLRRKGHDRMGVLERAKPLVHRRNGDSRVDALVDQLTEIWTKDPSERVLVAAQDNLTVDYLFEIVTARLPLIGPMGRRRPLVAARIRQGMMTEAVEDLGGYGNETNENLESFQRGEAQVLFAPEAGQVGLNLQCARILVLYSVPWKPEEVEQWIGRLDRIGNSAVVAADGNARIVEIYTIAQRGLVDEKVVAVLQSFHTFERSVNLDGEHLDEVAQSIETAALRPERTNWRGLEDTAEALAAADDINELESELRPHLPWTLARAWALRNQLDALPPAPLAITTSEHAIGGPRSWDRAAEGMLRLLDRVDEYSFKWNEDPEGGSFRSLWYRFGERGVDGKKRVSSRVVFSVGADPWVERSPRHAHAFITRRGDIAAPPRRHVTMLLGDGDVAIRPLHFVSFGNAIHDEIIESWLPETEAEFSIEVSFPELPETAGRDVSGLYLLRLSVLDPASWLESGTLVGRVLSAIEAAATQTSQERLPDLVSPFARAVRCAIEADIRWLRAQITAQLLVQGLQAQGGRWIGVGLDKVSALLDPLARTSNGIPPSQEWKPPEGFRNSVRRVLNSLRSRDQNAAGICWSPRFPDFERALQSRLIVVQEEARVAAAVARSESAKAESALTLARDQGNRGQITRASNARDAAADFADMTRVFWAQRENWLTTCCSAIQDVRPEERLTAVLRVGQMR